MEIGQLKWIGLNATKHVALDKKLDQEHVLILCRIMGVNFAKEVRLCLPLAMSFIVRVSSHWKDKKDWYHLSNMKYKKHNLSTNQLSKRAVVIMVQLVKVQSLMWWRIVVPNSKLLKSWIAIWRISLLWPWPWNKTVSRKWFSSTL